MLTYRLLKPWAQGWQSLLEVTNSSSTLFSVRLPIQSTRKQYISGTEKLVEAPCTNIWVMVNKTSLICSFLSLTYYSTRNRASHHNSIGLKAPQQLLEPGFYACSFDQEDLRWLLKAALGAAALASFRQGKTIILPPHLNQVSKRQKSEGSIALYKREKKMAQGGSRGGMCCLVKV